jgi:hypothetical protein
MLVMLFIPFLVFLAGAALGCPGAGQKDRRFLAPLPTDREYMAVSISHGSHPRKRSKMICLGRSPCPALNALANHGYIPRDGADVSLDEFLDSIDEVFNVDSNLIQPLVEAGLVFSSTGQKDTLNLDDLDHQAGEWVGPRETLPI